MLTGMDLLEALEALKDSTAASACAPLATASALTAAPSNSGVTFKIEAYDADHRDGVLDTIAWLRSHDEAKPKSSGFLTAFLQFLHVADAPPTRSLPLGWGEHALRVRWNEMGYRLLHAPFYVDMMQARKIVMSGELLRAPPAECKAFAAWLDGFFVHIELVGLLKQRFLGLKGTLCRQRLAVHTQYGRANSLYNESLRFMHTKPLGLYGEKVLEFLNELEMTLWDEEDAMADATARVSTPEMEFTAITSLFAGLLPAEPAGIIVAKLVAWMPLALPADDVRAFVNLLSPDVQRCISGSWLRAYAEHLHLLEGFEVDLSASTTYSRSRVEISPLHANLVP
ncbi:hypothetical protein ACHHYP_16815 [Achlya hypogyna]|uniref:Uncharacterized protein n=1 Tax=Achlya hypogyna TaxID=1202772 RepID=A0A1V9Y5Q3_ACHHY|nr:hypothetical protein ACHHYP_16815 [Achlya hypogyna]